MEVNEQYMRNCTSFNFKYQLTAKVVEPAWLWYSFPEYEIEKSLDWDRSLQKLISLISPSHRPIVLLTAKTWYLGSKEYFCLQVLKHHGEPGSHLPQRGFGRKCWRAHPRAFLSSRSGDYQQYSSLSFSIVITDIIFLPLDRRGFRKKRAKCGSWNYWSHPESVITFLWHPSITMTIFGVTTHCNHCDHCQGPYRHYILNALWILINLLCLVLTLYQVGTITVPCLAVHTFLSDLVSDHCYRT